MTIYTKKLLDDYLKNDWIINMIHQVKKENESQIRTNAWLEEIEAKRMIYADVYGDILKGEDINAKVLDVGGGVNALTKILAENCDYTLLDFLAHGGNSFFDAQPDIKWKNGDWYDQELEDDYDIIIANDIFPDVDQRMELFIEKMLPRCRELRLVVTYYNIPKFYTTKRVDDSEIMTFLSWDGEITGLKLRKYLDLDELNEDEADMLAHSTESVFRNGRQVAYVKIKGKRQGISYGIY